MVLVGDTTRGALHVGLNAHLLSSRHSYRSAGINWYIYNLLRNLPNADASIAYTVFMSERSFSGTPGLTVEPSCWPTHRPPVRIVWEQTVQPWALHRAGVDLIHEPAFVGPAVGGRPMVVTVHDLSFLLYPQSFRTLNRLYLKHFAGLSVRRARRVIAVSESTKQDLVHLYGLTPDKIDVVHNGVDDQFQPLPSEQVAAFRKNQNLPLRFLHFVGTLEPRKNVTGLIQAYARLPKPRPPLLLVGGKGWLYDEIFARVEALDLATEVHFVGYVPADELPWWYNAATLFVYPSLYEGFGLPPLEAMACGTPVITSTASSLPEVVGKAGLAVSPADTEALATAMQRVLEDQDCWESMQSAGLLQARAFSWQRTAAQTVDSYRRALSSGRANTAERGKRNV